MFHQHPNRRKPDVIYSRKISLQDVINASAAQNARSVSNVSINTAQEEIRKCSGITLRPLNVDDVSLESSRKIISPSLYWLVRLMITSDESGVDDFDQLCRCGKIEDERRVISISQDIIHCASYARVKLPKQIGLAMVVRHLTGPKQLVGLLNRMGHS